MTYFIYYVITQTMHEQFITQPEGNLSSTPDKSEPPKEEKITPYSSRKLAIDSPILRKAVGLPPEPESESADKQG